MADNQTGRSRENGDIAKQGSVTVRERRRDAALMTTVVPLEVVKLSLHTVVSNAFDNRNLLSKLKRSCE